MISRIFTLLFSLGTLWANGQIEKYNPLKNDDYFNASEPIADWENESAIVLAQKTLLTVKAKEYKWAYEQVWTTRKKILIQDKAAVAFWSNLKLGDYDLFEMQIIKPNGLIIEIDSNDFIEVNEHFSPSSFVVDDSYELFQYFKLAVENLSIGDIIDIAYQVKKPVVTKEVTWLFPFRKENTWKNFTSFTYYLNEQYPKQKEQYELIIDPNIYISVNANNGFEKVIDETTLDNQKRLVFEKVRIQKIKNVNFSSHFLSGPKLQLELSYCKPYKYHRSPLLLGQAGVPNSTLNEDRLRRTLFLDFHPSLEQNILGIHSYESKPELLIADLYQQYQKQVFNSETVDFVLPSYEMASNFYTICRAHGLQAELVVALPKEYGSIEHLISTSNLEFAVRLGVANGMYSYIYNFNKYSTWQDQHSALMGTKAYVFEPAKKYKDFYFESVELPKPTPAQNSFNVTALLGLNLESKALNVQSETRLLGQMRNEFAYNLLSVEDYGYVTDFSQFDEFKLNRYYKRLIEKDIYRRDKYLRNWVNEDFDLRQYIDFELVNTGLKKESSSLIYKEHYTINDIMHFAGNGDYLILDIGKIITGQVALMQDEAHRDVDIVVEYPKQYNYSIEIQIPKGWKPKNLNVLSHDSQTPAGSFISSYNLEEVNGNMFLHITTSKTYGATFLPKESWSQMQKFLDAAFHFSQQKIVFEKE